MRILGIETSADDTGVALIEADGTFGADFNFKVLGNVVASQSVHASYGGIFPAIAKRKRSKQVLHPTSHTCVSSSSASRRYSNTSMRFSKSTTPRRSTQSQSRWGLGSSPASGPVLISRVSSPTYGTF